MTYGILQSDTRITVSLDQITSRTTLLNCDKSTRGVAKILGISKTTAINYRKVMVTEAPDPKLSRPRKLTSRDKQTITRSMVNVGVKTAVEMAMLIIYEKKDKASNGAIQCTLKEEGLMAFKKKKKPFPSETHQRARLNVRWITKNGLL